ncbi:chloride channel protein [Streptomyces sp. HUAS TT20]|uniref:chloride channel protein n=1 Tax=Streptomyces sp. HUAS TT20 TaxID=3447509 RepID=UPI0021D956C9|nr:chloride channel protein [Streptomyces sp. HUAS 15-9]UXY31366.1 chloride channel protein [Streptomyces sp. HUAS 15-9]
METGARGTRGRSGRRSLRVPARFFPLPDTDDSLARWVLPAALIGVVAGLGAAALFGLLHLCTGWLLESVAGYRPYRTSGEGGFRALSGSDRPWLVPLVAAGGALVATAFAVRLAPEARGHGTDAAIAAAHHDPTGMRGRVTVVKLVASAVTIGSGGSGGTEGPAAQISAAFGSVIARRTGMTREQARTALVIGLAAGVGAIFRAPLGGALLGAELLYRRDMDARVLPKALIASVAGWLVFGACHGFSPSLGGHGGHGVGGATGLALVAVVGLVAGSVGRLYTACFYAVHTRVEKRARGTFARVAAPTVAGLLVGGLGLLVPGVLGTGYGLMEALTSRSVLLDLPLAVVLAIPLAKIVGTALTVGSGGSGGIFGPCMVVGAGVGAAVWRLAEPLGLAPGSPLVPVAVGMAACLGAVAHAPLGVLVMVAEMLGDASLLGPGILAVLCARSVTGGVTLYRSQLERITDEPEDRIADRAPDRIGDEPEDTPPPPTLPGPVVLDRRARLAPVRREPVGPGPVTVNSADPAPD